MAAPPSPAKTGAAVVSPSSICLAEILKICPLAAALGRRNPPKYTARCPAPTPHDRAIRATPTWSSAGNMRRPHGGDHGGKHPEVGQDSPGGRRYLCWVANIKCLGRCKVDHLCWFRAEAYPDYIIFFCASFCKVDAPPHVHPQLESSWLHFNDQDRR